MTTETIRGGTAGVNRCRACCSVTHEHDRFCRCCGAKRSRLPALHSAGVETTAPLSTTQKFERSSRQVTAQLAREAGCKRVSGPLVKSVTANLSANTIACFESNLAKRLILAVISIPIWMIIVLLSPIDAYLLARTAVRQEN